jgi:hypothetical protein
VAQYGDNEITLLLLQVRGDEAAVLSPGAGEVETLRQFRCEKPKEVAQVLRVLEQPEGAPVVEVADEGQEFLSRHSFWLRGVG